MYRVCIVLFYIWLSFLSVTLQAQSIPDEVKSYIEDYYSIRSSSPDEIDVNIIFDQLSYYIEHPLSINQAERKDLEDLFLLDPLQITEFLDYRDRFGPFVDLFELQAIPGFDLSTIRRIRPFFTLKSSPGWGQTNFSSIFKEADLLYFLRYNRFLEPARGFRPSEGSAAPFEGDPGRLFTRIQYRATKKFSLGFTGEKDPGEAFFEGSNPYGFDYNTYHLFLQDIHPAVEYIAVGDYNLSLGQGLILHSGFGGGKSSNATNIKRSGSVLRPHTSIAENTFLRGIASSIKLNQNLNLLLFYSNRSVDANLNTVSDTSLQDRSFIEFTSVLNSGFHRTVNELEDEKSLRDVVYGGQVGWSSRHLNFHLNYFREQFSVPLNRRDDLYNLFVPESSSFHFYSIDYTYIHRQFQFFGETAFNGKGWASLNGFLSSFDRKLQFALLYRHFEKDYFSLNANSFGESQQANNEEGLYAGIQFQVSQSLGLSAYADIWRHPWVRFNIDAPSFGKEYLIRMDFRKKRKWQSYLQFRIKERHVNQRQEQEMTASIVPFSRMQLRFHTAHTVNKDLELRYRAEYIRAQRNESSPNHGYLLYADIIYKPIQKPFSFTSRMAIFNSDSYDARLYAFENNLLYSFSIPAYFNRGVRTYFNYRMKIGRNLTWEFRWAKSWYFDVERVGTGFNEVEGNQRTELGSQIKLVF